MGKKEKCSDCSKKSESLDFENNNGESVCKKCFDNYCSCDNCSEILHSNDKYTFEGNTYCQNCYDERIFVCNDCSEVRNSNNSYSIHDSLICNDCYRDNYFNCDACGEYYSNGEYGDDRYCNGCYENNNNLHNHGYKPIPQFFKLNSESKFFGIELEVEKMESDISIDSMCEKITINNIYCKSDGSLTNGIEIVTHPHSFEYLKKNKKIFDKIINIVKDAGYKSYNTETCGIHIHISKNSFNTWHLYRFMKFFADNKLFILKISQRKEKHLKQWANLDELTQSKLIRKAKDKFEDGSRYQAINLTNRKTIEIRIFRGTLHIESFYKNIEFLESLYQFTLKVESKKVILKNYLEFVTINKKIYNNLFNWLSRKEYLFTLDNVTIEKKKQKIKKLKFK